MCLQHHQILRLPRQMNLMADPWDICNVIHNARSNMRHSPTSAKVQRNLLETHKSQTTCRTPAIIPNFTEYCAFYGKWYYTSPKYWTCHEKEALIIDSLHTWNVTYNEGSNKCHCPNSQNTAPATTHESHDWSLTQMTRCAKYCACHEKWPCIEFNVLYLFKLPAMPHLTTGNTGLINPYWEMMVILNCSKIRKSGTAPRNATPCHRK